MKVLEKTCQLHLNSQLIFDTLVIESFDVFEYTFFSAPRCPLVLRMAGWYAHDIWFMFSDELVERLRWWHPIACNLQENKTFFLYIQSSLFLNWLLFTLTGLKMSSAGRLVNPNPCTESVNATATTSRWNSSGLCWANFTVTIPP